MGATTKRIRVEGMTCGHCEMSVRNAIAALPGVTDVLVDRTTESATFAAEGDAVVQKAVAAVNAIGFEASAP